MIKSFLYIVWGVLALSDVIAQPLPTVSPQPVFPGFLHDLKGEILVYKYSKVTEGTAYFSDEWLQGKAFSSDGKVYNNLSLKLDLVENEVHFLNDQAQEMILSTPVNQLLLTNVETGQTFTFIKTDKFCLRDPKIWYQVLDTGKAWLLKTQPKQVIEFKPYGSAITEEKIVSSVNHYLIYNMDCFPIKSAQELWEKLDSLLPGFTEKVSFKGNSKKSEEEMIRLTRQLNVKASDL